MIPEHYINCGKLKILHRVLKKWVCLNRHYCEAESWKDCAWWANERASTSLLAAAAWAAGGIALEEYSTPKERKKKQRTGRCDLYIKIGKKRFACEAKQVFPRFRNADHTSDVKERFLLACSDARDLSPNEGRRLGICFVTPRCRSAAMPTNDCLKKYLANLRKLKQELKFDAFTWYFPHQARAMKWLPNKRTYPGIVMLIREI